MNLCVCDCISEYVAVHVCVPECGSVSGSLVSDTHVLSTVPEGVSPVPRGPHSQSWFSRAGAEWVEVTGRHGSKGAACVQRAGGSANVQQPSVAGSRPRGTAGSQVNSGQGEQDTSISRPFPSFWGFLF